MGRGSPPVGGQQRDRWSHILPGGPSAIRHYTFREGKRLSASPYYLPPPTGTAARRAKSLNIILPRAHVEWWADSTVARHRRAPRRARLSAYHRDTDSA